MRTGLIFSAAAVAVMAGASWWTGQNIPADVAQLPVHWGADGRPDRFLPRDEALRMYWLLPGFAVVLTIILAILPSIDPLKGNIHRSSRAYLTAWIGSMALLALVSVGIAMMTVRGATGDADSNQFVRWIMAGVGVLFIFLGDAMPKTRPNFFVGVRTPWTLSSDLAWQKTHRLAGWLFVLAGFWAIVAAFTLHGIALALAVTGPMMGAVAISAVYSWFVWKDDPDKRQSIRNGAH
jgi:uncharacterized membrane protein